MSRQRIIIGIAALVLLLGGVGIGVYLTQQQQDVRQRAEEPSITPTPTGPACIVDEASCEWDPTPDATSYHFTITETGSGTVIDEGDIDATITRVTFTSEPNKTYKCSAYAINACGQGEPGEAESACTVSPTPTPTGTPIPTPTQNIPSPTPTATPTPTPTPTTPPLGGPSPTPTNTPVPTATPTTPPVPTDTPTPTPTQVVTGPTNTPTPTIEAPGSALQTFTVAAGLILTIIGAIVLFAL